MAESKTGTPQATSTEGVEEGFTWSATGRGGVLVGDFHELIGWDDFSPTCPVRVTHTVVALYGSFKMQSPEVGSTVRAGSRVRMYTCMQAHVAGRDQKR